MRAFWLTGCWLTFALFEMKLTMCVLCAALPSYGKEAAPSKMASYGRGEAVFSLRSINLRRLILFSTHITCTHKHTHAVQKRWVKGLPHMPRRPTGNVRRQCLAQGHLSNAQDVSTSFFFGPGGTWTGDPKSPSQVPTDWAIEPPLLWSMMSIWLSMGHFQG